MKLRKEWQMAFGSDLVKNICALVVHICLPGIGYFIVGKWKKGLIIVIPIVVGLLSSCLLIYYLRYSEYAYTLPYRKGEQYLFVGSVIFWITIAWLFISYLYGIFDLGRSVLFTDKKEEVEKKIIKEPTIKNRWSFNELQQFIEVEEKVIEEPTIKKEVFCTNCGTKLSSGAKFCENCGNKV